MLFNLLLWTYFSLSTKTDYPADYWVAEGRTKYERVFSPTDQDRWAEKTLRPGDIVCRRGNAVKFGFNFSNYISNVTESKYSHCGMVSFSYWIYDMDEAGLRQLPFSEFMKESSDGNIVVLRLKKEYDDGEVRTNALLYVWNQFWASKKFDYNFSLTTERFYCAELITKSYAESRILLSAPVKIGDLPAIENFPLSTFVVQTGLQLLSGHNLPYERGVYIIGNDRIGLLSSRYLYRVYEGKVPE